MARTIKIGMGYNGENIIFHLGAISLHDEQTHLSSFNAVNDLAEPEKSTATKNICVEAIANWSTKSPTKMVKDPKTGKDEEVIYLEDSTVPAADVRKIFGEILDPIDAERIAHNIVLQFRIRLQPDVVF